MKWTWSTLLNEDNQTYKNSSDPLASFGLCLYNNLLRKKNLSTFKMTIHDGTEITTSNKTAQHSSNMSWYGQFLYVWYILTNLILKGPSVQQSKRRLNIEPYEDTKWPCWMRTMIFLRTQVTLQRALVCAYILCCGEVRGEVRSNICQLSALWR